MARSLASFSRQIRLVALAALLGVASAGCDSSDATNWASLAQQKVASLLGKPTAAPDTTSAEEKSESSRHREVNAEFLKEMFYVVLLRDVRSADEFNRYMNMLDQGAHYEGIYNGIVYSSEYREREKGVASVTALRSFAKIMARLTLDQRYDPLRIVKPERPDVPKTSGNEPPQPPQPTESEREKLEQALEREGMTKSVFTLKRELGAEVLKTIELKKEYREKLATWYGRFSVMVAKMGVDFGLEQRNRQDEYFHYQWALGAEEDRIKWECLNRVHTVLNGQSAAAIATSLGQGAQPQAK